MVSKIRPRKACVSEEAPTTATECGHSKDRMSGTGLIPSAQAEAAGDDATHDFRRAALNGQLRRNRDGNSELLIKRRAVGRSRIEKGCEFAYTRRQLLLPKGAEIFDNGALDYRLLARLQHAGDRNRHAAQGVELRDQPAEPLGAAHIRLRSHRADQFEHDVKCVEKPLRSAPLVGEFAGRLLPGAADLATEVVVGAARV